MEIDVFDYVKKHYKEIKKEIEKGDKLARDIGTFYQLLVDCPSDPGARGLLEGAIEEWEKRGK
jgi:hypothetical protein